jgi:hypothetical protein
MRHLHKSRARLRKSRLPLSKSRSSREASACHGKTVATGTEPAWARAMRTALSAIAALTLLAGCSDGDSLHPVDSTTTASFGAGATGGELYEHFKAAGQPAGQPAAPPAGQ